MHLFVQQTLSRCCSTVVSGRSARNDAFCAEIDCAGDGRQLFASFTASDGARTASGGMRRCMPRTGTTCTHMPCKPPPLQTPPGCSENLTTLLYGPLDPLPPTTRRILVTGASGAGKSRLRETISTTLHLPTVEMDSLHHGPDWTPRPTFAADVDDFTSGPSWVIEWQYSKVRALLLDRADTLIWLDHNRWTVTQRAVRRTLRRRTHHTELWNGNYEPPLLTILTNRDHIVRWSWTTHRKRRREALDVAHRTGGPRVVRLTGQTQVDTWVRGPLRQLVDHEPNPK